jgi:outer membrane protein assembly factor BamB
MVTLVDHGVVYVTSGTLVIALRATDGRQLWQTSVTAISGSLISPAQAANGTVYIAFRDDSSSPSQATVYAINAGNGTIRWRYTMAGDFASLSVVDGMVYAYFPGALVALDAGKGSVRWKWTYLLSLNKGPVMVTDGVVYVGDPESGLIALDAVAGRLLWQQTDVGTAQTLIVDNGMVYVLAAFTGSNPSGAVLAVDARGGSVRWRTFLDNTAGYSPFMTLAGNMLYVGGDSAYALRTSDGHVTWRYGSRAQFYQPAVYGSVVFIASTGYPNSNNFPLFGLGGNDFLNALSARTGALYWRTSGDVECMPLVWS